jgi:hypothetical protein
MLFLIVAGAFSALTPEPLWVRAMSFVVFGFVPALAAYLIPCLISWTLRRAGRIYDPVAAVLWPAIWGNLKRALSALFNFASHAASRLCSAAHQYFSIAGRPIVMGVTFPIRLCARLLLKLIASATGHEHRQVPAARQRRPAQRINGARLARAGQASRVI